MSRGLALGTEQLVDLVGLASGTAAARLVELAKAQGYTVAATAPGTYRLARTRRRLLVDKRTESVVVTVFSDRTGTKARIVGPLDDVVIERLRHSASGHGQQTLPPGAGATASPDVPATIPSAPPVQPAPPPSVAPAPAATAAPHQVEPGAAWWQPSASAPTPTSDIEDRTVARSSLRPPAGGAMLVLPGGRSVQLDRPVVVGRNPDPSRGPAMAVAVAIPDPSISKTHAAIDVVEGVAWVTDLHSTNGTRIEANGASAPCTPGQRRRVDAGSTIVAGDVRLHVRGVT